MSEEIIRVDYPYQSVSSAGSFRLLSCPEGSYVSGGSPLVSPGSYRQYATCDQQNLGFDDGSTDGILWVNVNCRFEPTFISCLKGCSNNDVYFNNNPNGYPFVGTTKDHSNNTMINVYANVTVVGNPPCASGSRRFYSICARIN